MRKSLFVEALAIAQRSLGKHRERGHFLHYSFVVQNNKIVEWGTNNKKVPARHYGYHHRISDPNYGPKTHSEIDAWKKARDLLDERRGFQMINIRLNRRGELRNSKPCSCCFDIIRALGCSKFFYSSNIGFMSC